MIRITSSVIVAGLMRRAEMAGATAAVARPGAEEAGAILVTVDRLDGTGDLYVPAPQSAFTNPGDTDRLFTRLRERAVPAEIAALIAREVRFDPDVRVVGVGDRHGRAFVDIARD